jgi:hypothetical protein
MLVFTKHGSDKQMHTTIEAMKALSSVGVANTVAERVELVADIHQQCSSPTGRTSYACNRVLTESRGYCIQSASILHRNSYPTYRDKRREQTTRARSDLSSVALRPSLRLLAPQHRSRYFGQIPGPVRNILDIGRPILTLWHTGCR